MSDALPIVEPRHLETYDVPGPRYTSYPTVPEWSSAFGADEYRAALRTASTADAPLSLYVHVPFCWSMCSYCGCNVIVTHDRGRADAYIGLLEAEIARVAAELGRRRAVAQLHLGGGTPTFLDERQFERLWRAIGRHFTLTADVEATVEINPAVTTRSQITALRALGVNRLSMGVQDFDPLVQETIGRRQTVEETRALCDYARALGFSSVNFDLIYGLPHQTPTRWEKTVEAVIGLAPDRLAVYSFAYVPGFKPHQRKLPQAAMPGGVGKIDLFRQAWAAFVDAGYVPIGMDHFAAPGDSLAAAARSGTLGRNFQGYTVKRASETVAFGLSAISDIGGVYAQNHRRMADYRAAVEGERLPIGQGIALTSEDERRRAVITELMCNLAVDLGPGAVDAYRAELGELGALAADGLVSIEHGGDGRVRVAVAPRGRLFLRNIAMPFDARLRARGDNRFGFSRTV